MKHFKHVNNLWTDADAIKLSGLDRLVYRSNVLGSDLRITNTGGGNMRRNTQANEASFGIRPQL